MFMRRRNSTRPRRCERRPSHPLRRVWFVLMMLLALLPQHVQAHDPDTRGGLFRTYDAGATWTAINPGVFVSGALGVAVSPLDPNHLLLATESGVWRSRNGGRDWDIEAANVLTGPAFAAAFAADGQGALVATASAVLRDEGGRWQPVRMPFGATPARALVAAAAPGRVYLAGRSGLYRSDDGGRSWASVAGRWRDGDHVDGLLAPAGRPNDVHALVRGSIWSSSDGARRWQRRADGAPVGGFEAVGLDPRVPTRLWAAAAGRLFESDDPDARWRAIGHPIPDALAKALAMAISGTVVVVATDRGVFRSVDGGDRWETPTAGLPAHLAARILVVDPRRPDTLHAGFAFTTYDDLLARAPASEPASSRPGLASMAAGFLAVFIVGVIAAMRPWARS